jgi:hypothetical protein
MSQNRHNRSLFIRIPSNRQIQPNKRKSSTGKFTRWKPGIWRFLLYQPHLFPVRRRSLTPIPAFLFTRLAQYDALLISDIEPEAMMVMHDIAERLRQLRDQWGCSRVQLADLADIDLELLTAAELGYGSPELSSQVLERVEERLRRIDESRTAQQSTRKRSNQGSDTSDPRDSKPADRNRSQRSLR